MKYEIDENYYYYDIQNIFLDHPLNSKEIDYYKDLIFSPNNLKQIYFSNDVDLKSIEVIKSLLIISDYIDDSQVEKIVLVNFKKTELKQFINMNFANPFTWKIPMENKRNSMSLTELPNYRKIYSFINMLKDNKLSNLEQITKIYDKVKLMNYSYDNKNTSLFDIIETNSGNSYGLNKLFSFILEFLGFKTFIGRVKDSNLINYITIVEIKDKKYQIDGIYVFEPSMDTLPKTEYKNEEIRRTNYNFFGRNLMNINELIYNVQLMGVLELLSTRDYKYSENKLSSTKDKELLAETKNMLDIFNLSFKRLYNKINSSLTISCPIIININNVLYEKNSLESEKRNKLLYENYVKRNKELFNPSINEIIEEFSTS